MNWKIDNNIMNKYEELNKKVLQMVSIFLNDYSKIIKKEDINNIKEAGVSSSYAYALMFANLFQMDLDQEEDKIIFHDYFLKIFCCLDEKKYTSNKYYQNISLDNMKFKEKN